MSHQAGARVTDADKCAVQHLRIDALVNINRKVNQAVNKAHKRGAAHGNAYTFRQLTRIDIPADDINTAQTSCSNSAVTSTYDIVAVQPCSERALAQACTSLDVDIISLDLSKRLPYRFKPATVQSAIQRGIHFEIAYAPMLRDPGSRKQLLANAQALCRETRGRNIVLSSAARTAMELRGPHDVMNLATFFGMSQQQAQAALGRNALLVLSHARTRKAYRGSLISSLQAFPGRDAAKGKGGGQAGSHASGEAQLPSEPAKMDVDEV